MDEQMAMNLVVGMLEKSRWKYTVRPDNREARILWGSTAIYVSTETGTVSKRLFVTFRVPLVSQFEVTNKNALNIYKWANLKNGTTRSGRFYVIEGAKSDGAKSATSNLQLEFELLADNLHDEDFTHTVSWIGGLTDKLDDEFTAQFGGIGEGERLQKQAQRRQSPADGPTVEA